MKTTPTLGLKLYDGTDAPDLVSGYNASMEVLEDARIMRFLGVLTQFTPDFNDLKTTGYYNANGYTFTKENHGPVGSHNIGLLVVYDRCLDLGSRACATQQYFPRKDGTGDAYRPMVRTLAAGEWSAWAPLVEVPDAPTWETLEGKPFSTVGKTLTTRDNTLDLSTAAQASLVPAGGAAGQVLAKSSASDYDCEWMNPSELDTIHEIKTGPNLTAWLKAFPSTGEWWSGPGEVTITANGSTQQYTGNWTVYRTPSIGNAYFQGSEGRAATAHFASLKTDHNANVWAFVMSIKDTEPTFQYVGVVTTQLTAMLKRVTTFDAS